MVAGCADAVDVLACFVIFCGGSVFNALDVSEMAIGPFGSSKICWGAHLRITDIGARSISRLPPTISRRVFQPRGDPVCSCIIGCDSYRRGFRYPGYSAIGLGPIEEALQDNRFGAVPALLGLSALPLALQWYLLPGASLAQYRVPGDYFVYLASRKFGVLGLLYPRSEVIR